MLTGKNNWRQPAKVIDVDHSSFAFVRREIEHRFAIRVMTSFSSPSPTKNIR
jgi:hypothetical protein